MFARRSRLLGTLTLAHDSAVTALAFFLAYWLRTSVVPNLVTWWKLPLMYPVTTYWPVLAAMAVGWPLAGYALGVYRNLELSTRIRLLANIFKMVVAGLLIVYAGLYLTKSGELISRSFVVTAGAVDVALLAVGRWLFLAGAAWLRERLGRYHYILIVGTGPKALALAGLVEEGESMGLRLVAFVDIHGKTARELSTSAATYRVIQPHQILATLHQRVVDEVIFAVELEDLSRLKPLMNDCAREGVNTRVELAFPAFSCIYLEKLRDVPLLSLATTPDSELLLFAKRVFDLVTSGLALALLSPLMAAITLLVKVTSPGPALYRQVRSGLGGRRFTLYKFRSMVENAEELRPSLSAFNELRGPVFKMSQDPRCTPLGRWLRRFSLDELPQLWNVFRGEMSFVGPRPALPEEVEQYEPWQRRRLRMRPGLTCTWVLEGRNSLDFERLIQLDLSYIDHWSLWLDLEDLAEDHTPGVAGAGSLLKARHGVGSYRYIQLGSAAQRVPGIGAGAGLRAAGRYRRGQRLQRRHA